MHLHASIKSQNINAVSCVFCFVSCMVGGLHCSVFCQTSQARWHGIRYMYVHIVRMRIVCIRRRNMHVLDFCLFWTLLIHDIVLRHSHACHFGRARLLKRLYWGFLFYLVVFFKIGFQFDFSTNLNSMFKRFASKSTCVSLVLYFLFLISCPIFWSKNNSRSPIEHLRVEHGLKAKKRKRFWTHICLSYLSYVCFLEVPTWTTNWTTNSWTMDECAACRPNQFETSRPLGGQNTTRHDTPQTEYQHSPNWISLWLQSHRHGNKWSGYNNERAIVGNKCLIRVVLLMMVTALTSFTSEIS